MISPDDLTGDARRAHFALHGQTLHDSWMKFCEAKCQADALQDQSDALWGQADALWGQSDALWDQADALWDQAHALRDQAHALWGQADAAWHAAVQAECGGGEVWTHEGCALQNGESYAYTR